MTKRTGFFLAVCAITFFCFIPDLSNGLLNWDDTGYILDNVQIRTLSFETVTWAFTEYYCNYWAPLTWLSLALDYAVWGTDPFGYHLTNNIIHALNGGLFFLISLALLTRYAASRPGAPAPGPNAALYCSCLAALFFGIHPLRVESVVWAAERKDVLSALFGFGAVLAYLRYTTEEAGARPDQRSPLGFLRSSSYWGMLFLYSLSLLSKAMLITLPLALLVLDWFPLGRLKRENVKRLFYEKLPVALLAALSSAITFQALEATRKSLADVNLWARVLTAFKSIALYLRFMLFPIGISPVYFHPGNVAFDMNYGISIIIVSAITAYCLLLRRQKPVFLAAWLVFLITLLPVIGLTQNGQQEMAPRFTYIPGLSLALLAALGITVFWEKRTSAHKRGMYVWAGAAAILAFFSFMTVRDTGNWKNDTALWSRVIELQPHEFGKAYFQRSLFLNLDGEYGKALSDVNEALAIASRKKYGAMHEIYAHRASILSNMRDYDGAIADLSKAIELSGEPFQTIYYGERGALYEKQGDLDRARRDLRAAGVAPASK